MVGISAVDRVVWVAEPAGDTFTEMCRSCGFDVDRDLTLCGWLVHCTDSIATATDRGRVHR